MFAIPDKYKDKPWAEGIDSIDAAFTKLDGAETLIGKKRTIIPDDTSTPDDIAAFNRDVLKVPDNADDYEPVNTDEGADNAFFDAMKPVFKKIGLSKDKAKLLATDVLPILEKITGKKLADDTANNAEFDTITANVFGDTKVQDLAQAKVLMTAHTPECFKDHVAQLDNKTLTVVASVLKGVRAKYMAEDGSALLGDAAVSTGADAVRKQAKEQIAIAQNPESTAEQKETAGKKARELYEQYDKMTK